MSRYFIDRSRCAHHDIFTGVHIHTAHTDHLMLSVVEFDPHAVVEKHSHPHEQMGLLLEGELDFTIGEERKILQPGQMWRIPGGVPHRVVAGDVPVRALDVFHPIREDYI